MDFSAPPDSRWTLRGSPDDVAALLRRASDFLESLGPAPVKGLSLDQVSEDVVLSVVFDHWKLPADLDYLDPRVAGDDDGDGKLSSQQSDDFDFVIALAAELGARTVVDFGCGTGQLAVSLADAGRRVVAVDPARAMVDVARTRPGAEAVEWVWGGIGALDARDADLAVMTGNIPSIYVTDEGWDNVVHGLHAALRPGGHLAFGSWNPEARPWETWGLSGVVVLLAADKGARVRAGGHKPSFEFADGREALYAGSEWRYRTHEELTRSLTTAGFVVEETFGDWQRSPLTSASPYVVLVARRV